MLDSARPIQEDSVASGTCCLVGASSLFQQVLSIADAVARNSCVVLLEGESGTGKELIARRIHQHSPRLSGPFIPINCAGISETLFESQFYGHERGAFTGAGTSTLGIVRSAQDGTLLLDEVGEMPLHMQAKLLRLLQEHEVLPVGANRPVPVNARFIAATNRSLARQVSEGRFRNDLYHRLNVVRIQIPPLRSRPDDVEPLLDHYLQSFAEQYRMPPRVLGPGLRKALRQYHWPGNVRELACYVERMYAANIPPMLPTECDWDDGYYTGDSPGWPQEQAAAVPAVIQTDRVPLPDPVPNLCTLAEAETRAIRHALQAANQNRSAAARILQIHRSTLLRKLRTLGLEE